MSTVYTAGMQVLSVAQKGNSLGIVVGLFPAPPPPTGPQGIPGPLPVTVDTGSPKKELSKVLVEEKSAINGDTVFKKVTGNEAHQGMLPPGQPKKDIITWVINGEAGTLVAHPTVIFEGSGCVIVGLVATLNIDGKKMQGMGPWLAGGNATTFSAECVAAMLACGIDPTRFDDLHAHSNEYREATWALDDYMDAKYGKGPHPSPCKAPNRSCTCLFTFTVGITDDHEQWLSQNSEPTAIDGSSNSATTATQTCGDASESADRASRRGSSEGESASATAEALIDSERGTRGGAMPSDPGTVLDDVAEDVTDPADPKKGANSTDSAAKGANVTQDASKTWDDEDEKDSQSAAEPNSPGSASTQDALREKAKQCIVDDWKKRCPDLYKKISDVYGEQVAEVAALSPTLQRQLDDCANYTFELDLRGPRYGGQHNGADTTIRINPNLPPGEQAVTLGHETTHAATYNSLNTPSIDSPRDQFIRETTDVLIRDEGEAFYGGARVADEIAQNGGNAGDVPYAKEYAEAKSGAITEDEAKRRIAEDARHSRGYEKNYTRNSAEAYDRYHADRGSWGSKARVGLRKWGIG